jgi:hypothetical protein
MGANPVRATVDGTSWDTGIWRDSKSDGSLLAVPAKIRGGKRGGDKVTVAFAYDSEDNE